MQEKKQLNTMFSKLKPSSTLAINETVNKLWAQGKQVFHMGFGESRFDVHPMLQQSLAEHANKKSYLPARGLPELIDAVANYHSKKLAMQFDPSQVIIGPGSKSLIYGLQMVLDADVFLPTPSWVSYEPQAHLLGKQCFYIPSSPKNNYQLDLEALNTLIKRSTNHNKLLVLNTPNNPTGEIFSKTLLKELTDYCRLNNVLVLSDEIYFQICFDGNQHTSIANYYPEGTIITGGLSKHLSLGGWRLGVALLPESNFGRELMNEMVVFSSETWSGVSAPIQHAAITAYSLNEDIEDYVRSCVAIHGIRTQFIYKQLSEIGVRCSGGKGAFYITANFDDYAQVLSDKLNIATNTHLAEYLLTNYGIACLPGFDFGIPENVLSLRLSTSYLDMENESAPSRIYSLYQSKLSTEEFMSKDHHPNTLAAIAAFKRFINQICA